MEERKFTEKESLELISQMISASRQRLQKGSGNPFLYYGYTSIAISAATFLLGALGGSWAWNLLWMLMFIPAIVLWVKDRDSKPEVTSYIDRMLTNTWKVVLMLMVLSLAVILGSGFGNGTINLMLMLPLALIFVCTGTLITGLTIGEGSIVGMTTIAFVMPILLLAGMVSGDDYLPVWNLAGGFSFLFSLVIPGHIINHRSSGSC